MTSTTAPLTTPHTMAPTLTPFQHLAIADEHLNWRVSQLRREYARANASINSALAAGTPRNGKNKLRLSTDDLVQHMQHREDRIKCQHLLLLLVPLKRLTTAAVQQAGARHCKSSRQPESVAQMLAMRCAGALPLAKAEVQQLCDKFPAIFGISRPAKAELEPVRKQRAEKALGLHSKLLASGLLTGDELETLRLVFAQYRA